MRLLHTADWHAGRALGRRSLDEGLEKSLEQLVQYAVGEKVDAVLVAGDVFDQTRPTAQSQELVYRTLLSLYRQGIPVALIAGNHDSVGHWQSLKGLFQLADIHITSQLSSRSVQTLKTRSGPLQLASLPWPNERMLSPLSLEQSDADQVKMSWADQVRKLVQVLCRQLGEEGPRVLMGHLMLNGSRVSCSQRALTISDTYAVSAEIFPPNLNYVALGHVHQPQKAASPVQTCYAGSLRPLDFGEAGHARGFYRVEVASGRPTEVEFVELPPAQPLHQIELERPTLERELQALAARPGFYKVVVRLETPEAGLADRVRQLLPQALVVQALLKGPGASAPALSCEKLLEPMETFRHYHQARFGAAPEAELEDLFRQLLEESPL